MSKENELRQAIEAFLSSQDSMEIDEWYELKVIFKTAKNREDFLYKLATIEKFIGITAAELKMCQDYYKADYQVIPRPIEFDSIIDRLRVLMTRRR